MQLLGQISEIAAANGWISAELITVMQVMIFLVLGYVVTAAFKWWCSREIKVSPKKLDVDDADDADVACSEQAVIECTEELMPPAKTPAQSRQVNAQERKRNRKAKEAETKKNEQTTSKVSETPVTVVETQDSPPVTPVSARSKKAEKKNRKAQSQKDVIPTVEANAEEPESNPEVKTDSEDGQTTCTPTSQQDFEAKSDSETSLQRGSSTSTAPPTDLEAKSEKDDASIGGGSFPDIANDNNLGHDENAAAPSNEKPQIEEACVGQHESAFDDQEKLADMKAETSDEPIDAAGAAPEASHELDEPELIREQEQVAEGVDAEPSDYVEPHGIFACNVNFDDIESDSESEVIRTPSEVDSLPHLPSAPVMWCNVPQSNTVIDGNTAFPVMMPQIEAPQGYVAVAMPAECAPPGALDGLWQNDTEERILIDKLKIMFESGITWDMTMHSMTKISVFIDGSEYIAELDASGRHLLWSDGDIWTFFGQAQQSPQEPQWNPEAMAEMPCMTPVDMPDFQCMMMPVMPENVPTAEAMTMPPKNTWIPRDAKKWEMCWDWKKKGWCPRGADCDWYHPSS